MTSSNVEIKGLAQLTAKITRLSELKALDRGLQKGALQIKAKIAKYPPATGANTPNGHWYERGYGPRWKGGTGGKRTSETLSKKWTVARQRMLTWIVGNIVSYGKWVQDEDYQVWFHKRRGWPTTQMVARLYSDLVTDIVKREVDLELEK